MLSSIRKLSHCVKIISLNSIQMPTNPFKNIHLFEFQIHFIALNNLCFVSITHVYYIHLYFAFCYWLCCHNQDGVLYSPEGRKLSLRPCARCAKGIASHISEEIDSAKLAHKANPTWTLLHCIKGR